MSICHQTCAQLCCHSGGCAKVNVDFLYAYLKIKYDSCRLSSHPPSTEAAALRFGGARTIIALGHSGIDADRRIAAECPLVDLVVGAHSNTFMWNGAAPSTETPLSPYPLVVEQPASGKRVPVVQAFAYGKYVGVLNVSIAANGSLVAFAGQPLLMDGSVPQDAETLALLDSYRPSIEAFAQQHLGETAVPLSDGRRNAETPLGNLVCDAMVHAHVQQVYNGTSQQQSTGGAGGWIDGAVAVCNSGAIEPMSKHLRQLSMADVYQALPYDNLIAGVWLRGAELRELLELSARNYDTANSGGFLQVSGVRVVYDVRRPRGERVHEVRVLCANCTVPRYEALRADGEYLVLVPDVVRLGMDGYEMMLGRQFQLHGDGVAEAVRKYVLQRQVVYPAVEGRIRFAGDAGEADVGLRVEMNDDAPTAGADCEWISVWLVLAALIALSYNSQ